MSLSRNVWFSSELLEVSSAEFSGSEILSTAHRLRRRVLFASVKVLAGIDNGVVNRSADVPLRCCAAVVTCEFVR